jgi:hypothetical protein
MDGFGHWLAGVRHGRSVAGVTRTTPVQRLRGPSLASAANHTRSAGSYRTRPTWWRSTAFSCLSTSSGVLRLVAVEHQEGHAGHTAGQQVDDLEQHSASNHHSVQLLATMQVSRAIEHSSGTAMSHPWVAPGQGNRWGEPETGAIIATPPTPVMRITHAPCICGGCAERPGQQSLKAGRGASPGRSRDVATHSCGSARRETQPRDVASQFTLNGRQIRHIAEPAPAGQAPQRAAPDPQILRAGSTVAHRLQVDSVQASLRSRSNRRHDDAAVRVSCQTSPTANPSRGS